jgi:hypothetical protein
VAAIDNMVAGIDDRAASVDYQMQQTANDVDEVKCLSSPNLITAGYGVLPTVFRESISGEHTQMALPTGPLDEP